MFFQEYRHQKSLRGFRAWFSLVLSVLSLLRSVLGPAVALTLLLMQS